MARNIDSPYCANCGAALIQSAEPSQGVCERCRLYYSRHGRHRIYRSPLPKCDCGQPGVEAIIVTIGSALANNALQQVVIVVCTACRELEQEMQRR